MISDEAQTRVAERTDWDEKGGTVQSLHGRVRKWDEILVIDFTMGSRPRLHSTKSSSVLTSTPRRALFFCRKGHDLKAAHSHERTPARIEVDRHPLRT